MYIPVMLETRKLRITLFGGGSVALRKLRMLEGAYVTVVSQKINDEIRRYAKEVIIKKVEDEDEIKEYIKGSNFIIIATDDKIINTRIRNICENMGKIYNLVDDRESVSIFPSYIRENDIIISFSTSGRSPALAKFLKELTENFTHSLDVIERIRENIEHDEKKRSKFFSELFRDCNFWSYMEKGDKEKAYSYAMEKWVNDYDNN